MTVPVPAGAGGVDREAIAKRRTEAMSALLSVARALPDLLVSGCVRTSRQHAADALHASLLDVRALLAALAAAEQRADTAEAESAERDHRAYEHGKEIGRASMMGRVEREKQRADTLAAANAEALRLHPPKRVQVGSKTHGGGPEYGDVCVTCREPYPCPTVAALSSRPVQPEGKQR